MKPEVKQVIITPEYAAELLKMNINNRSVRTRKVAELADAMRKGEWELSNDAIVISEGNILLNQGGGYGICVIEIEDELEIKDTPSD